MNTLLIVILVVSCLTLVLSSISGFVSTGLIINQAKKKALANKKAELEKKLNKFKNLLATTTDAGAKLVLEEKVNELEKELKSL